MEKIHSEIKQLTNHIKYHNYRYYTLNKPEISDKEYDNMFARLKALEERYPEYKENNSPTENVGSDILKNSLKKVKHHKPMLSLDKARDVKELEEWLENTYDKVGEVELGVYLKADGLSMTVTYGENGYLQKAVTRGNGTIGEDITHSALAIPNFDNNIGRQAVIRGEVVLPRKHLKEINKIRLKNDLDEYINCRNAASGILRNKEISDYIKYLEFHSHNQPPLLRGSGILTPKDFSFYKRQCQEIENNRADLVSFELDGVVLKVEDKKARKELGSTSHHPKWAVAFKFESESKKTILEDIEYQVSRTGRINPVGVIKPIKLTGAKISKVTLHNFDLIEEMQLKIGDEVQVERAGDVIPKIIENHSIHKNYKLEYPKKCPECGSETLLNEEGNFLYCTNSSCPAKVLYKFEHFIKSMNIKSVGIKTLKQIIEKYSLSMPYQLYHLEKKDLLELSNTKDKKATKIYNNIQASKEEPLWRVIGSLGISGVGKSLGKDIADYFKGLQKFNKASYTELYELKGIAGKTADKIIQYIESSEGSEMINTLIKYNIGRYEEKENTIQTQFAITGSFDFSRKEIKRIITQKGGSVKGFSGKTEILLAGNKAGSKLEKAKKKGIEVWNKEKTEDFLEKII